MTEKIVLTNECSTKITVAQFVCGLIIVLRHSRVVDGGGVINLFKNQGSIFIVALPCFFFFSGYLFFKGYHPNQFCDKLKGRVRTVLIPYLIFNALNTIYRYLIVLISRKDISQDMEMNIIKGVFFNQYNGEFWYIQQIMIYFLFAPILYMIFRSKYIGVVSIFGLIVLQRIDYMIPVIRIQHLIFYAFGSYIALNCATILNFRPSKKVKIVSFLVGIALIAVHYFYVREESTEEIIIKFILLGSFWNVCDAFAQANLPRFAKWSFFIYATHSKIEKVINSILTILLPKTHFFNVINFFGGASVTVFIIYVIGCVLSDKMPRVWRTVNGGRT